MLRRQVFTATLATASGIATMLQPAAAAEGEPKNIIFTQAEPGHWAGPEGLHVPEVTIEGSVVTVKTLHPMSDVHYIVSHSIVLEGGTFLSRKTFTYKDQPVSEHTLPPGYKGRIWVTSTCNQHDWWLKEVTV